MSVVDLNASLSNEPDGSLVVALEGELDMESSRLVSECVSTALDAGEVRIVIDLRDVRFIDSRGLAALVTVHRDAEEAGKSLVVRSPTKRALDLFKMTGIDQVLQIET